MIVATMFFRCGSFEFKVGGYDESQRPSYVVDKPCALAMGGKRVANPPMAYRDPNPTEPFFEVSHER